MSFYDDYQFISLIQIYYGMYLVFANSFCLDCASNFSFSLNYNSLAQQQIHIFFYAESWKWIFEFIVVNKEKRPHFNLYSIANLHTIEILSMIPWKEIRDSYTINKQFFHKKPMFQSQSSDRLHVQQIMRKISQHVFESIEDLLISQILMRLLQLYVLINY